jgi:hypothetical protein
MLSFVRHLLPSATHVAMVPGFAGKSLHFEAKPGLVLRVDVVWTTRRKWGGGVYADDPAWRIMAIGAGWIIAVRAYA